MRAAPPLLSFLLILLQQSGWSHGLCKLENSTVASCHQLKDVRYIDTDDLEFLKAPVAQDVLTPGLFSKLDNLRHLDLSGGELRKIERGCFQNLSSLRSLNLGDNRIEYLELASLEGLTELRSLNLRRNAIRQLPPALMRLKNLRHLDIHGNPLECNCATLKVRDLVAHRGVTMSKKVVCAGPSNMKGTSLMKPSATIICSLEKQDREMQNDQPEGSGMDAGSGDASDAWDEFAEEEETEGTRGIKMGTEEGEEEEEEEEDNDDDEYVEVHNGSSEKPKEAEAETPIPAVSSDFTTRSSVLLELATKESTEASEEATGTTTSSLLPTADDDEIFFDSEERKEQSATTEMSRKVIKDSLFYPASGDGYDASGEGSGAGYDEERTNPAEGDSNEGSFLWNVVTGIAGFLGATAAPPETKEPNLEEEQFLDVSTKLATEEPVVSITSHVVGADLDKVTGDATRKATSASIADGVEVMRSAGDGSKSGNVKAEVDSLNDELAEVSTSKQSKKGMGSYVVLAVLLAVLAALIGFAAYKGDFCRKKRKRDDVENGTELKDMQKSLLPDTGNAVQPKIASNGNAESVPLVEGAPDEDARPDKIRSDDQKTQETPRSLNGTTVDHPDPVKPPRKQITPQEEQAVEDRPRVDVNSLKENFLADRPSPVQPSPSSTATNNGPATLDSQPNGPPLSPGAQRVRITLQEIPDSVPKTPILITRTMAGENLVKTP
ncbi:protein windpipe [Harpegnathos saltator]|uniref:Synleurin n=1 Tax=Harpegnathos saltator TaxID=610380 RepID=E2BXU0_HARSA|nr:protein windpipe [Harpegnathos saltator]XP_011147040.1 protein windpipe [Harpegnathos saltator]XP_025161223.1 protein windpipe [Harpegnathos saltator]EFN79497.1 Synleurin [Harpegnathos saltator]